MRFDGSRPGPGRPKGQKNKYRFDVAEAVSKRGVNPFDHMAEVMGNEEMPPELRMKAAIELAGYLAPKLRSVEHTTSDGAPLFVIMGAQPAATAEDWAKQHSPEAVH